MSELIRVIWEEVADLLPALTNRKRSQADAIPVDAPDFPHDLEPVIRSPLNAGPTQ